MALQTKKVEVFVKDSQKEFLRIQVAGEKDLQKIYYKSSNKVAAYVNGVDETNPDLNALSYLIVSEIDRLTKKVDKTSAAYRNKIGFYALDVSIESAYLYKEVFKADFIAGLTRDEKQLARYSLIQELNKPINGLTLSDRIWDTNQISLNDIRENIAKSFLEGKTKWQISQECKKFLIFPESDMRTKKWRKFWADNPPGRGRYRSAYKNVERVYRTETNRAYREAFSEYAKLRDWVKGIQRIEVPNPFHAQICVEIANSDLFGLGKGVYPVGVLPDSNHPACICYDIMVPKDEYLQARKQTSHTTWKKDRGDSGESATW